MQRLSTPAPTLNQLFPGEAGRLRLIRWMLRLQLPELRTFPRDAPLDEDLYKRLLAAEDHLKPR